jgi:pseudaminic acid cytidylyltransferase
MIIAIIPARGGSKRIPRKNIRPFLGKPIIGYSIEVALASGLFDQVIVSTDDAEIAATARTFGAETPFTRPKDLSDDYTGTDAVVRHAISWLMEQGKSVSTVCCIYPTAPFIQVRHLVEGHERLVSTGKSFCFTVTSFEFPVQRALRISADGGVQAAFPEHISSRSQDLEKLYHDAGQFYWGRGEAYLDEVDAYSAASVPVILPQYLVQDIDTVEHWHRAERMYRTLQMSGEITS